MVESLDRHNIYDFLKIRPLSKKEVSFILSFNENVFLVDFCQKLESVYYLNIREFLAIKKNLVISFFEGRESNWSLVANLLNCYLFIDKDKANEFFYSNITEIDSKWIFLFLSSSIGRDVDLVLSTYNHSFLYMTDIQLEVFKKYLISNKVGLSLLNFKDKKKVNRGDGFSLSSKSYNIAICVSGQLRGYELAKKSWDVFFNGNNIDYYIHTWKDIGAVNKKDFKGKRINPSFLNDFILRLKNEGCEKIDSIFSCVLSSGEVDERAVKRIYGADAKIVVDNDRSDMSNHEKMYYKIYKSFNLIQDLTKYDLVVRLRPDVILKEEKKIDFGRLLDQCRKGMIFTEYGYALAYYGFGVDDKIAISSPDAMRVYSNFWEKKDSYKPILGHISLASYLYDNNIDVGSLAGYLKLEMNDAKDINEEMIQEIVMIAGGVI